MPRALRRLLSITAYPVVMACCLATAIAGIHAGVSLPLLVGALTLFAAFLAFVLEAVLPYRAEWSRPHGDVGVDLVFSILSGASSELARLLAVLACAHLAARAPALLGVAIWPTRWPLIAQLVPALIVGEFGVYVVHRFQHRGGLLFRLHAAHHSVPRLYWLNNGRNHPLDVVLTVFTMMVPLLLLGAGPEVIALLSIVSMAHAFFQHSNIDLRFGPLNWILSTAEVHRHHHARDLAESNANYGQNTLFWDLCFGTRRVPDRPPPVDVGLHASPSFPTTVLGQLASPLRAELFERDHTP